MQKWGISVYKVQEIVGIICLIWEDQALWIIQSNEYTEGNENEIKQLDKTKKASNEVTPWFIYQPCDGQKQDGLVKH